MRITIREGFAGVLFRKGLFVRVLKPGRHRYSYWRGERVEDYDIRIRGASAFGLVTTTDKVSVTVTVPFTYVISDLKSYVTSVANPDDMVRSVGMNAVTMAVAGRDLESLETNMSAIMEAFRDLAQEGLKPYGMELHDVFAPAINVPKNIRNASEAQLAAKKKALADLEEARGRTAVLRHYANAAELIKDKPEILQLMLGQKAKNIHIDFSKQK